MSVLAYQEVTRRIEELTRAVHGLDPYFVMPAPAGEDAARALAALAAAAGCAQARRARAPAPAAPRARSPARPGGTTYAEIVRGHASRSGSACSRPDAPPRYPSEPRHSEADEPETGAPPLEEPRSESVTEVRDRGSDRGGSTRVYESDSAPVVDVATYRDEFVTFTEDVDYDSEKPADDVPVPREPTPVVREPTPVARVVVQTVEEIPVPSVGYAGSDCHERDRSRESRGRSQDLSYAEILALGLRRQPKAQVVMPLPKPQVAQVEIIKEIVVDSVEIAQPIKNERVDTMRLKPERPERSQRSRSRDMPRQRRAPEKRPTKAHEGPTLKKKKPVRKVIEVEDFEDVELIPDTRSIEVTEKPEVVKKEITKKVQHSPTVVETVTETVSTEHYQQNDDDDAESKKNKKKKTRKPKTNEDEIEKALKEIESSDKHKKKKVKDVREKHSEVLETNSESSKAKKNKNIKDTTKVMVTDFITIESEVKPPEFKLTEAPEVELQPSEIVPKEKNNKSKISEDTPDSDLNISYQSVVTKEKTCQESTVSTELHKDSTMATEYIDTTINELIKDIESTKEVDTKKSKKKKKDQKSYTVQETSKDSPTDTNISTSTEYEKHVILPQGGKNSEQICEIQNLQNTEICTQTVTSTSITSTLSTDVVSTVSNQEYKLSFSDKDYNQATLSAEDKLVSSIDKEAKVSEVEVTKRKSKKKRDRDEDQNKSTIQTTKISEILDVENENKDLRCLETVFTCSEGSDKQDILLVRMTSDTVEKPSEIVKATEPIVQEITNKVEQIDEQKSKKKKSKKDRAIEVKDINPEKITVAEAENIKAEPNSNPKNEIQTDKEKSKSKKSKRIETISDDTVTEKHSSFETETKAQISQDIVIETQTESLTETVPSNLPIKEKSKRKKTKHTECVPETIIPDALEEFEHTTQAKEEQFEVVKSHKKKNKSRKPKPVDDEVERALKEIEESQSTKKDKVQKRKDKTQTLEKSCVLVTEKSSVSLEPEECVDEESYVLAREKTSVSFEPHKLVDLDSKNSVIKVDWNTLMAEEESATAETFNLTKPLGEESSKHIATEVTIVETNTIQQQTSEHCMRENKHEVSKTSRDSNIFTAVDMSEKKQGVVSSTSSPGNEQNNNDKNFNSESLKDTVNVEEVITTIPVAKDMETRTIYLITHEEKKLPPIRTVKVFSSKSNSLEETTETGILDETVVSKITDEMSSGSLETLKIDEQIKNNQSSDQKVESVDDKESDKSTSNLQESSEKTMSETNTKDNFTESSDTIVNVSDTLSSFDSINVPECQDIAVNIQLTQQSETIRSLSETLQSKIPETLASDTAEIGHEITISKVIADEVEGEYKKDDSSRHDTSQTKDKSAKIEQEENYSEVANPPQEQYLDEDVEQAIFGSVKDRNKSREFNKLSIPYEELETEVKTYSLVLDIDQLCYDYSQYVQIQQDKREKTETLISVDSNTNEVVETENPLVEQTVIRESLPTETNYVSPLREELLRHSSHEIQDSENLLASTIMENKPSLETVVDNQETETVSNKKTLVGKLDVTLPVSTPEKEVVVGNLKDSNTTTTSKPVEQGKESFENMVRYLSEQIPRQSYHEIADAENLYALTKTMSSGEMKEVIVKAVEEVVTDISNDVTDSQQKLKADSEPETITEEKIPCELEVSKPLCLVAETPRQSYQELKDAEYLLAITKSRESSQEPSLPQVVEEVKQITADPAKELLQAVTVSDTTTKATISSFIVSKPSELTAELPRQSYHEIKDAEYLLGIIKSREGSQEPDKEPLMAVSVPATTSEIASDTSKPFEFLSETPRHSYHELKDAEYTLAVVKTREASQEPSQVIEDVIEPLSKPKKERQLADIPDKTTITDIQSAISVPSEFIDDIPRQSYHELKDAEYLLAVTKSREGSQKPSSSQIMEEIDEVVVEPLLANDSPETTAATMVGEIEPVTISNGIDNNLTVITNQQIQVNRLCLHELPRFNYQEINDAEQLFAFICSSRQIENEITSEKPLEENIEPEKTTTEVIVEAEQLDKNNLMQITSTEMEPEEEIGSVNLIKSDKDQINEELKENIVESIKPAGSLGIVLESLRYNYHEIQDAEHKLAVMMTDKINLTDEADIESVHVQSQPLNKETEKVISSNRELTVEVSETQNKSLIDHTKDFISNESIVMLPLDKNFEDEKSNVILELKPEYSLPADFLHDALVSKVFKNETSAENTSISQDQPEIQKILSTDLVKCTTDVEEQHTLEESHDIEENPQEDDSNFSVIVDDSDDSDFVIISTDDVIVESATDITDSNDTPVTTYVPCETEEISDTQDTIVTKVANIEESPLVSVTSGSEENADLQEPKYASALGTEPVTPQNISDEFLQREIQSNVEINSLRNTSYDTLIPDNITDQSVLNNKVTDIEVLKPADSVIPTVTETIEASSKQTASTNIDKDVETLLGTGQNVLISKTTDSDVRTENVKSPIHSLQDLLPSIDSIPEFKPSYSVLFSNLSADAPEFTPSYMYKTIETSSEIITPLDDDEKQFPDLIGNKHNEKLHDVHQLEADPKTSYSSILQTKKEKEVIPVEKDISELSSTTSELTVTIEKPTQEDQSDLKPKKHKKKKKKDDKRDASVEKPVMSPSVVSASETVAPVETINVWAKCADDGKSYAEVVAEGLIEHTELTQVVRPELPRAYESPVKTEAPVQIEVTAKEEPHTHESPENSWAKIVAINRSTPERVIQEEKHPIVEHPAVHKPPVILVDESDTEHKPEMHIDAEGFIIVEKRSRSRSRSRDNRSRSKSNVNQGSEKREKSENRFEAFSTLKPETIESVSTTPDVEEKPEANLDKRKKLRSRSEKSKEKEIDVETHVVTANTSEIKSKKDKKKRSHKSKEIIKPDEPVLPKHDEPIQSKPEVIVTETLPEHRDEIDSVEVKSLVEEIGSKKKNKKKKKEKSATTSQIQLSPQIEPEGKVVHIEEKIITQSSVSTPETINTPIKDRLYNEAQFWKNDPSYIEDVLTIELSPSKEVTSITMETKQEPIPIDISSNVEPDAVAVVREKNTENTDIQETSLVEKITEDWSLESKMADLQREIEEMLLPEDCSQVGDSTPKELIDSQTSDSQNDVLDSMTPLLASPEHEIALGTDIEEIPISADKSPQEVVEFSAQQITTKTGEQVEDKHISVSMIDALLEDEPAKLDTEHKYGTISTEPVVKEIKEMVEEKQSAETFVKPVGTDFSNTAHDAITNTLSNTEVDNFWVEKSEIGDAERPPIEQKQLETPEIVSLEAKTYNTTKRDSLEENIVKDSSFWPEKHLYHDAELQYFLSIARKSKTPPISKVEVDVNDQNDKDKDPSGSSGHASDADESKDSSGSPFDSNYISMDLPGGICSWKDQSSYLSVETPTDSLTEKTLGDAREDVLTNLPLEPAPPSPLQEPAAAADQRTPKVTDLQSYCTTLQFIFYVWHDIYTKFLISLIAICTVNIQCQIKPPVVL